MRAISSAAISGLGKGSNDWKTTDFMLVLSRSQRKAAAAGHHLGNAGRREVQRLLWRLPRF